MKAVGQKILLLSALVTTGACSSGELKQETDPAKTSNLCEAGRTDNRLTCETARDDALHAQNKGDFAFMIDHPFTNSPEFEVTWTALVGEYTYTFFQADDRGCTGPSAGFGSVRSLKTPKVNAAMIDDGVYYYCIFADSAKHPTIAAKNNGFQMTLDTAAPEAPKVDGELYTNNQQPIWYWSSSDDTAAGYFRVAMNDESFPEGTDEFKATQYQPPTPLADGQYFLFVQERDEAGNWSESGAFDTIVDTVPPKPVLEQVEDTSAPDKLHVTVTFSEQVSGFDKSDIKLSSGTISKITGDGKQYKISISSATAGTTIEIPEGGCEDIAGNPNLGTEPLKLETATPP